MLEYWLQMYRPSTAEFEGRRTIHGEFQVMMSGTLNEVIDWQNATVILKMKRLAYLFRFSVTLDVLFFSIWVFFHGHSRVTGLQGNGEGFFFFLTRHYPFHPLHRHLDISRASTAESSSLLAGSRTRTGKLWFPSASH